ncbi:MAG: hypothetical protein U9R07_11930 [Pseudomonadota bacterium]|nr:hypothetical protein [Pseudomonadota bacterium]
MGLSNDVAEALTRDARLVILAQLARQRDETLNSPMITRLVDGMGFRRSQDWIETQLRKLEDLGAVTLSEVDLPGLGQVIIARLTRTGRDHVERRSELAGVSRPTEG